MGCRLQLVPKGEHTAAHRHTASSVYHVAEGSGFSILDGIRFDWRKGDTFAVPIWCWHEHAAPEEDAVLFTFTDQPVMAAARVAAQPALSGNRGFSGCQSDLWRG